MSPENTYSEDLISSVIVQEVGPLEVIRLCEVMRVESP